MVKSTVENHQKSEKYCCNFPFLSSIGKTKPEEHSPHVAGVIRWMVGGNLISKSPPPELGHTAATLTPAAAASKQRYCLPYCFYCIVKVKCELNIQLDT